MIKTAVMTCWAAPMKNGLRGGNALWSLAALCARQHFDRLVLFADELGESWLCDGLGLPFDSVERLDIADSFLPLWALPKIVAYRTMAERGIAFAHIDGDACLLEPLLGRLLTGDVIAEMAEVWSPPALLKASLDLPHRWKVTDSNRMWNCGIFGGNDTHRIRAWSSLALQVAKVNEDRWGSVDGTLSCMMLEQWSLSLFFGQNEIETLLPAEPASAGYVHLKEGKQSPAWRRRVERELIARFPAQAMRLGLEAEAAA